MDVPKASQHLGVSRPLIALLDLEFHKITRSSDFFIELLEKHYEVVQIYMSETCPGRLDHETQDLVSKISALNPDFLIQWQVWLPAEVLITLGIPVIWVPMLDSSISAISDGYVQAAKIRMPVIAFSSRVVEISDSWRLPCLRVQYYSQPLTTRHDPATNERLFFWYRGGISLRDLDQILAKLTSLSIIIKDDPDPGAPPLDIDSSVLKARVERVVRGFLPLKEYSELVSSCGLYVAPRRLEGIGLSFVNAMSLGLAIVAFDAGTMNEYLVDRKSGFLFGSEKTTAISADEISEVRTNSIAAFREGHQGWLDSTASIHVFIQQADQPRMVRGALVQVARLLSVIRSLRSSIRTVVSRRSLNK